MKKLLNLFSVFLLAAMLVLTLTIPSKALLIGGPDIIAAPASVIDDAPGAENDHQQAFNEVQSFLLTSDLEVDGSNYISSGMIVDSHMIFFNTVGSATSTSTATWTFDGLILGVMSDAGGTLEAGSSSFLGAAGTVYPAAFANRGLEGGDSYTVSGASIAVTMVVSEPGDWIRVVTASQPVPEPSTLFLLGVGLFGIGAAVRKRRS